MANKRIYDLVNKNAIDINNLWEVEIDRLGELESSKINVSELSKLITIDSTRINDVLNTTYVDTDEIANTIVNQANTSINTDDIIKFNNGLGTTKVSIKHNGDTVIDSITPLNNLTIKGSTTGTSANVLIINDSIGTSYLKVKDDGKVFLLNGIIEGNLLGKPVSIKTSGDNSLIVSSTKIESKGDSNFAASCDKNSSYPGYSTNLGGSYNSVLSAYGFNLTGSKNIIIGSARNVNTTNTLIATNNVIYLGLMGNYIYDSEFRVVYGKNTISNTEFQINSTIKINTGITGSVTASLNTITGTGFLAVFRVGQVIRMANDVKTIISMTDTVLTVDTNFSATYSNPIYTDRVNVFDVKNGSTESLSVDKFGNTNVAHQLNLGVYTTAQRDLLTVTAGAIIFNSTLSKHQGFDGTIWNNLY